ncbi:MAG TPA: hypothetical protein VMT04_02810 [Terriglobales bacterium]|nr:hypothetical protein [Terriglobales bacterium]
MSIKIRICIISIIIMIFSLSATISVAQTYQGTDKEDDSSNIDHSVYEKVKSFIAEKQKLFDPDRFTSNMGYLLGGFRGCSYGTDDSPYRDSLIEICMQGIESKYLRPRGQMIDRLDVDADLSDGENLLEELQAYYPEAAAGMFRNYLDSLGASIDSLNQAYLYVLEPETSGTWRQFETLSSDLLDNAIDDYVQANGDEIYQIRLMAVDSGEKVRKLGDELIAFLSNYIRTTGKLF